MTAAVVISIAVAIFVAGAVAGIIAVVSIGVHREDRRHHSLVRQAPDRVSQGARFLTGLHVRQRADTDTDTRRPRAHARLSSPRTEGLPARSTATLWAGAVQPIAGPIVAAGRLDEGG